jgi:hypothetical protein
MEKYLKNFEDKIQKEIDNPGSIQINNEQIIKKYVSKSNFPYLISFPRTGSHWFRILMELYFEKPALVRIFYFKDAKEFTCYHDHDLNLNIQRENVIYLYRYPVDTIYSQLKYYDESIDDKERVRYWSVLYRRHLSKWLLEETFSLKKTVINYDKMVQDLSGEFKKACEHFEICFDLKKFMIVNKIVKKREIKKKTFHDPKVINLTSAYQKEKKYFKEKYSSFVMKNIFSQNNKLRDIFCQYTDE